MPNQCTGHGRRNAGFVQECGRCPVQAVKDNGCTSLLVPRPLPVLLWFLFCLSPAAASKSANWWLRFPVLPWRSTKSYAFGWIGAEGSFDEGDKDSRCFRRGAANGRTNVLSVFRVERCSSPRTRSKLFHRNVAMSPSRWPV